MSELKSFEEYAQLAEMSGIFNSETSVCIAACMSSLEEHRFAILSLQKEVEELKKQLNQ